MQVFIQKQLNKQQPYQWYLGYDEALSFERFSGQLSDLQSFADNYQHIKQWVLLLPAADCISKYLRFSEQERKHIAKAIPYLLEETVLTDVEGLHLISDKPEKNKVAVNAIDKTLLNYELDVFDNIGIHLTYVLPEQVLFTDKIFSREVADTESSSTDHWQLIALDDYSLLRIEEATFAIEPEHLNLALDISLGKVDSSKTVLIDLYVSELKQAELFEYLSDHIKPLIHTHTFDYASTVQGIVTQANIVHKFNFLKGSFARTVNWLSMLKPWRSVLLALFAVYCVQVSFMWVEKDNLQKIFDAQQTKKEALFRQVKPRGNIVDYQKQLERELTALQGGGSGDVQFIEWLDRMGSVMAGAGVQSFNSIQFESKSSLMRLDFLVPDYDTLQNIIAKLKEKGFEVEIQNSNAQDDALRARLNVKG